MRRVSQRWTFFSSLSLASALMLTACGPKSYVSLGTPEEGDPAALSLSDDSVRAGEVFTLDIEAGKYCSGLYSVLELQTPSGWRPTYVLVRKVEPGGEPGSFPYEPGFGQLLPGSCGDWSEELKVPATEPGQYRISKEFFRRQTDVRVSIPITILGDG